MFADSDSPPSVSHQSNQHARLLAWCKWVSATESAGLRYRTVGSMIYRKFRDKVLEGINPLCNSNPLILVTAYEFSHSRSEFTSLLQLEGRLSIKLRYGTVAEGFVERWTRLGGSSGLSSTRDAHCTRWGGSGGHEELARWRQVDSAAAAATRRFCCRWTKGRSRGAELGGRESKLVW